MSFTKLQEETVFNVNQSSPPIAKIREFGIVQFPLDILSTNEDKDKSFFTEQRVLELKTLLRLLIIIFFNLFFLNWIYAIMSIYFMIQVLLQPPHSNVSRLTYFSLFLIDYILSLCSAVLLYGSLYGFYRFEKLNEEEKTYFYWSVNCWMFYIFYTIIFTYNAVQVRYFDVHQAKKPDPKEERVKKFLHNRQPAIKKQQVAPPFDYDLGYLFRKPNFESLGLGKLQADYLRRCTKALKNQDEIYEHNFRTQVKDILKHLNIDLTLSYFSIFKDIQNEALNCNSPEIHRQLYQNNRRNGIENVDHSEIQKKNLEQCLRSLNFKGQRQIVENFLLPNYMVTRSYLYSNPLHRFIAAFVIILMKIVIPTLLYNGMHIKVHVLFYLLLMIGFYLHFVIALFDVSMNDDLKTRNYIFLALKKLLSVNDYQSETDRPNLLDISCALSLQSWEKMRRIALYLCVFKKIISMIESKRTLHFNHEFTFLAWYGKLCFALYLLCGFELPFMKNFNYCNEDLLVYNVHFDCAVVVFVCALRIQWGQRFRTTFSELRELMHGLEGVYSDLSTMFEYYFEEQGIEAVLVNDQYKELIKLIKIFAKNKAQSQNVEKDYDSKEIENRVKSENSDEEDSALVGKEKRFAQEKLTELITAAQQMVFQVEGDEKRFESTFMSMTGTTMDKFSRIVVFLTISFVPGLLIKLQKYINQLF